MPDISNIAALSKKGISNVAGQSWRIPLSAHSRLAQHLKRRQSDL